MSENFLTFTRGSTILAFGLLSSRAMAGLQDLVALFMAGLFWMYARCFTKPGLFPANAAVEAPSPS